MLIGKTIELEQLQEHHRKELYSAAQDEKIWTYAPISAMGDQFDRWFHAALEDPDSLSFVVRRRSDKKLVGSTRFYNIEEKHRNLIIGYTWYTPDVWGTVVNPESKYLLLQHAFETLAMNRVAFHVDARNLHSRAAVRKLGAIEEGILRQHKILPDGFVRDTVVFSIIKSEWLEIKKKLEIRCNKQ